MCIRDSLTELLKQGQFSPLASEEQVILLYAGVNGYMDTIEVNQINHFEEQLMETIKKDYANILDDIRSTNLLSDDNEDLLKKALEGFLDSFKKNS